MQHRIEVTKPLLQAQPGSEQRVFDAQDLGHAARPANALADMQHQPLGREPRRQPDTQIRGRPSHALQAQRGMRVLGHGLEGEAVGIGQRHAADDRAGSAKEGGVPQIIAALDRAVEQIALAREIANRPEIPLHRIGRIEVMRRLDERERLVPLEPAHRHLQERAGRHVIAVEDRDQRPVGVRECGVEVAGLGMGIVGARDIAAADRAGKGAERRATAVVEQVDVEPVARIIHVERSEHGRPDDLEAFVVRRDIDVDGRPVLRLAGQFDRLPVERPGSLQHPQRQDHPRIEFGQIQAQPEHCAERALELERRRRPPEHIPGRHHQRQQRERHRCPA